MCRSEVRSDGGESDHVDFGAEFTNRIVGEERRCPTPARHHPSATGNDSGSIDSKEINFDFGSVDSLNH